MGIELVQDPRGSGYLVFKDNTKRFFHRWIAEQKYRKEEIRGKVIHHIDGIKTNNDRTNLVALSKEDHYQISQYHNKIKLLADILLFFSVFSFLIFPVSLFLLKSKAIVSQFSIILLIMIVLIVEIRSGFFKQMILSPRKRSYSLNP